MVGPLVTVLTRASEEGGCKGGCKGGYKGGICYCLHHVILAVHVHDSAILDYKWQACTRKMYNLVQLKFMQILQFWQGNN